MPLRRGCVAPLRRNVPFLRCAFLHADATPHVGIALVLHIRTLSSVAHGMQPVAHCTLYGARCLPYSSRRIGSRSAVGHGLDSGERRAARHSRVVRTDSSPRTPRRTMHAQAIRTRAHARASVHPRACMRGRQDRPRERTHRRHRFCRHRLQRMRVDASASDRQCTHTVSRDAHVARSVVAQTRNAQHAASQAHGAINRGLQHVGRDVDLTERRAHRVEMEDAVFRPYGRSSAIGCRG